MRDIDIRWRAEEACLNAWPARRDVLIGGWMLRLSGGRMRRPNSVTPLNGPRGDAKAAIEMAEAIYRTHGQSPMFRILSLADEMDALLDEVAYPREGNSLTIAGELETASSDEEADISLTATPQWLAARHRLTGDGAADAAISEEMLRSILFPTAFASSSVEGEVASLAYGVVQRGLLVIESVVTTPQHRGKGLARRTLRTLFEWGRRSGAQMVCLQVIAATSRHWRSIAASAFGATSSAITIGAASFPADLPSQSSKAPAV